MTAAVKLEADPFVVDAGVGQRRPHGPGAVVEEHLVAWPPSIHTARHDRAASPCLGIIRTGSHASHRSQTSGRSRPSGSIGSSTDPVGGSASSTRPCTTC